MQKLFFTIILVLTINLNADTMYVKQKATIILENEILYTDSNPNLGYIDNSSNEDPIDRRLNRCLDRDSSTYGINSCLKRSLREWDRELNAVYKELGGKNNIPLRNAERAWIKSKDAQIESLKNEYLTRDGSMWTNVYIEKVMDITKKRVLQLRDML